MNKNVENVIIIGGGPAGLAASLYLSRANLEPLVIAGSPPGGQLMLTTEVENFPGIKSILGPELIAQMRVNTEKFGTRFVDDNVVSIDSSVEPYTIKLASGDELKSKAILIATGAKAKWLEILSETRLRGKGVSACATCDGFFFRNKVVGVVGGGDTAMEEALTLTNFASKVYLFHRRDEFRASKIMIDKVSNNPKIEIVKSVGVGEVLGEEKVIGVKLSNLSSDLIWKEKVIDLDGLFIAIGHTPDSKFLEGSGVGLDEKGYVVDRMMDLWRSHLGMKSELVFPSGRQYKHETTVKNIFVAGDVADNIYRQASTASGAGVEAALEIEWSLRE